MRSLSGPITRVGAVVTVRLGVSAARRRAMLQAGEQVPPDVQADLLIDTGASCTLVDTGLMRSLGLEASGAAEFTSASTQGLAVPCDTYDISLALGGPGRPESWRIGALPILATSFINEPVQGLLGREVLNLTQLRYDGLGGVYTLSYR